jgi:hypothetical protein
MENTKTIHYIDSVNKKTSIFDEDCLYFVYFCLNLDIDHMLRVESIKSQHIHCIKYFLFYNNHHIRRLLI